MRAWLDCSVAAAGDMLLGALVDAGADLSTVQEGLNGLEIDVTLREETVTRGVLRATRVHVDTPDISHHRPWAEVRRIIRSAALPTRVERRALRAYERLAAAEARIHGVPVDEVELHEVGAADAIADIVGVCLALEALGIDTVYATALPMGTGSVDSHHGRLPLPAPATLAIAEGWPVHPGPPGEWVTPTGAALVTTLAKPGFPDMTLGRTGYGAGTRDPEGVNNVVRVVLGHGDERSDVVFELACTVDDMVPEHVPGVISGLRAAGALDAWTSPALMRGGRPGYTLHCLARPSDRVHLSEYLLRHTSTLGVRQHRWTRDVLDRWIETVTTRFGAVRIKVGGRDGTVWKASPEHRDVARLAREHGVTEREIYDEALKVWRHWNP